MTDPEARVVVAEAVVRHFKDVLDETGLDPARRELLTSALATFSSVVIDAYIRCLFVDTETQYRGLPS